MAKLFGIDIPGLIHQNLSPGLLPGVLTRRTFGARDPSDLSEGPAETTTTHTFRGVTSDYDDHRIDGTTVRRGDRRVIIIANSLNPATTPQVNDLVSIEGRSMVIQNVRSDPATAHFECQAR